MAQWDGYADVVRHVERASVFYHHELYSEAADEFDAALRLSPGTDFLLADAIMAHFRLGDEAEITALPGRSGKLSPAGRLYDRMR